MTKLEELAQIARTEYFSQFGHTDDGKADWPAVVQVVLEALEKPGEASNAAGKATTQELLVGYDEGDEQARSIYPKLWQAMLAAIIQEHEASE